MGMARCAVRDRDGRETTFLTMSSAYQPDDKPSDNRLSFKVIAKFVVSSVRFGYLATRDFFGNQGKLIYVNNPPLTKARDDFHKHWPPFRDGSKDLYQRGFKKLEDLSDKSRDAVERLREKRATTKAENKNKAEHERVEQEKVLDPRNPSAREKAEARLDAKAAASAERDKASPARESTEERHARVRALRDQPGEMTAPVPPPSPMTEEEIAESPHTYGRHSFEAREARQARAASSSQERGGLEH